MSAGLISNDTNFYDRPEIFFSAIGSRHAALENREGNLKVRQ